MASTPDRSVGTIQVEGMRELRRTLKQAGDDLTDLKTIHKQAAEVAAGGARRLVPTVTGRLASSIRPAGTKTAGIIRAGRKTVPYANAVHWGRHYWPNKEHARAVPSNVDPQPFLSEGAQDTESQWVALYDQRVEAILDQIKGK